MKQTSSGLDSLKLSLTPDDVSLVEQFTDSLDKQREPEHPGIPSLTTLQICVIPTEIRLTNISA